MLICLPVQKRENLSASTIIGWQWRHQRGWTGSYSFMLFPVHHLPITNILAPSFENAMPCWCSFLSRVRRIFQHHHHRRQRRSSKGVDRVYSAMSSVVSSSFQNLLRTSWRRHLKTPCLVVISMLMVCPVTVTTKVTWANAAVETSKVPDDQVSRNASYSFGLDRQFRRGQSLDCCQTRLSQGKGYGTGIGRSAKLDCSQGYAAARVVA